MGWSLDQRCERHRCENLLPRNFDAILRKILLNREKQCRVIKKTSFYIMIMDNNDNNNTNNNNDNNIYIHIFIYIYGIAVSRLHAENMNWKIQLLFFHNTRNLNAASKPRCIGHIGSGAGETSAGGRPEGVHFGGAGIPIHPRNLT